jgi:tripartite-type tricarboxylate transporter receptor subunit TctC
MNTATLAAGVCLAGAVTLAITSANAQQNYPNRPIRLISPYSAGGGNDTLARLLGQRLGEHLGQQVIVDNRPGANTIIGTDIVAKARPDGHTILFSGVNTFIINAVLVQTPYDIIKDFTPVAAAASSETIMVANAALPVNSLQELIALAKARPGELNYATSSAGGAAHLVGEMFKIMAGVNIQHVPYKGTAQALTDVIGGQVQLSLQSAVATIPHIKSGKLKGIAISGDARFPALPSVPTFAEAGMPGIEAKVVYGIIAPARMAIDVVNRLASEIARIQRMVDFKQKLASQGVDPYVLGPDKFAASIKSDIIKYAKIIKSANIKPE